MSQGAQNLSLPFGILASILLVWTLFYGLLDSTVVLSFVLCFRLFFFFGLVEFFVWVGCLFTLWPFYWAAVASWGLAHYRVSAMRIFFYLKAYLPPQKDATSYLC